MIWRFVREKYPNATFTKIYDAQKNGWKGEDFHNCCDDQGWTLVLAQTCDDFIFGGFTTANWSQTSPKKDENAFLFSVNEKRKYPIVKSQILNAIAYDNKGTKFGKDLFICS